MNECCIIIHQNAFIEIGRHILTHRPSLSSLLYFRESSSKHVIARSIVLENQKFFFSKIPKITTLNENLENCKFFSKLFHKIWYKTSRKIRSLMLQNEQKKRMRVQIDSSARFILVSWYNCSPALAAFALPSALKANQKAAAFDCCCCCCYTNYPLDF